MQMKRLLGLLIAAVVTANSAAAQTAVLPAPSPSFGGAVGGMLLYKGLKKTGKACIKHPILCGIAGTAAVVGGGAVIAKKEKARRKHQSDEECHSGYKDIFRVVSRYEYADIEISNRYRHGLNTLSSKEFWGKFEDALWYADSSKNFPESKMGLYIVTSLACLETLALAHPFTDAGGTHVAYAFEGDLLEKVNIDAHNTKGIRLVRKIKW